MIDAPVSGVWKLLRDFNGHDQWHPIVRRSMLEEAKRTDQIGCVRNFHLEDGTNVRECLLTLSDSEDRFRYGPAVHCESTAVKLSGVPKLPHDDRYATRAVTGLRQAVAGLLAANK